MKEIRKRPITEHKQIKKIIPDYVMKFFPKSPNYCTLISIDGNYRIDAMSFIHEYSGKNNLKGAINLCYTFDSLNNRIIVSYDHKVFLIITFIDGYPVRDIKNDEIYMSVFHEKGIYE